MPAVDPAILKALHLESVASGAQLTPIGHSGFTSTYKLTSPSRPGQSRAPGPSSDSTSSPHDDGLFFVKIAAGEGAGTMFRGEHASLNAIHDVVPDLCPKSHAFGELAATSTTTSSPSSSTSSHSFFLATDFLDLKPGRRRREAAFHQNSGGGGGGGPANSSSLAAKLAKLHTTPAPVPHGFSSPMFGFPVPTCCGDTQQDNSWRASWTDFFADNRLRAILRCIVRDQGPDAELQRCVARVADHIVPRLVGPATMRITPVVVHGDLWSGNHARGFIAGPGQPSPSEQGPQELVFDPSCVYGHSEYELGIMRMFGGFDRAFWDEYERLVPRADPVDEWDDRVLMYEL